MEEKNLSGNESLELIARMIRSTREGLKVGAGNTFLYFGYFTTILSVLLFLLVFFTQNKIWAYGWFLMFVFWGIMEVRRRKKLKQETVVTYTDTVLAKVWSRLWRLFADVASFSAVWRNRDIHYRHHHQGTECDVCSFGGVCVCHLYVDAVHFP